jgi:hypothetical protein
MSLEKAARGGLSDLNRDINYFKNNHTAICVLDSGLRWQRD